MPASERPYAGMASPRRVLRLSRAHAREIEQAAERAYPRECCGVILGTERSGDKTVTALHPTENTRADAPETRYAIAPAALLEAELSARARGVDVIGYYHSHPDAPASPSPHDHAHAWPWASYVIVSVTRGRPASMASWTCRGPGAAFDPEPIEVDD